MPELPEVETVCLALSKILNNSRVSDIEILYSDSLDLESKIKDGNNEVILSVYKNLPHVWQIFGFLPEAKQALKEIAYFLKN